MCLAFDIETNGLMPDVNKIQCINVIDLDTDEEYRFTDYATYRDPYTGDDTGIATPRHGDVDDGVIMLINADMAVAHNGIGYDFPVLEHVLDVEFHCLKRDSKVAAALIWTDLKDRDFALIRKGREFPKKYIGNHSLAAWGARLGEPKDSFNPKDYGHTWATMPFCQAEDDYCMQDVRTLAKLWRKIESKEYSEEAVQLEHDVQAIIYRQEQHGWLFDIEAAQQLTADLQIRQRELEDECRALYPPFYVPAATKPFIPKRDNAKMGYVKGVPVQKVKQVDFNPGSRQHIANRLMKLEGWEPTEFTKTHLVKVDETVLEALPYPSAKKIAEYMMVGKRLGQLAEGKEAWLKRVKPDGRLHGRVHTNGTVTGRMAHFHPNMGQVPSNHNPYGPECRSLFIVPEGKKLVGCDADGLELRCMGHFLAPFDGGAFIRIILDGRKEDGTDMHTRNQTALTFFSRDNAKTFFYAMIYGAGAYKLGTIVLEDFRQQKRDQFYAKFTGQKRRSRIARLGMVKKQALIQGITGMDKLIEKLSKAAKRGWIKGLDGRRVHVRSLHSVLNTLFQSAGAIVMKQAQVFCDRELGMSGLVPRREYEFIGTIHDEFQIESDEEKSHEIGGIAAESIRLAGEYFGFRCPLAGNFAVGPNWSCTH